MFNNYITIAIKNLVKNKLYSFINITGLALGLACCILMLLFVRDEISFENWLTDAELIHRIETTFVIPGRDPYISAQTPGPAKAALEKDFSQEIEQVVRIYQRQPTVDLGNRQFNEDMFEVDSNFFEVFDLPFVSGNKETALQDNNSIVLTDSIARKYFGDDPAVGKTFTLTRENPEVYRVSAVIEDLPQNTHLNISTISRFDPAYYAEKPWVTDRWTSMNTYIYVKFKSITDVEVIRPQMKEFIDANVTFHIPGIEHLTPSDFISFNLQPVPRIHLYSTVQEDMRPGGNITTVYTFTAIALLILLIASINFMNLATARSMERAREVSLRKVVGASRIQLISQFLGESVFTTILALVLAMIVVHITLPYYSDYVAKQLSLNFMSEPVLLLWLATLTVFVGVLGGLYPAFFLSRFRPAMILKSNQSSSTQEKSRIRNALVVLQFSISIGLIVTTLLIYKQTEYAKNMDLGFNKDHIVVLSRIGEKNVQPLQQTLRQEIEKLPGVIAIGRASDTLPQRSDNNTLVDLPDVVSDDLLVTEVMTVDFNFFQTIDMKPLAGRLFSSEFLSDILPTKPDEIEGDIMAGALINKKAVKQLGFGNASTAMNRRFKALVTQQKKADINVVGVVDDMHTRSIRHEITPMIYFLGDDPDDFNHMFVHVRSDNLTDTLKSIDNIWNQLVPEVPVTRSFVDEDFAALYIADEERMTIFFGFSLFSVLLACLGLFGLASFSAERRTKEIGLRKVMGASVLNIVKLLIGQFSKSVILANVIAWPIAYYGIYNWLENFKYRLDISPLPFLIAGTVALLIVWLTVGLHASRVARSNPIDALRYE